MPEITCLLQLVIWEYDTEFITALCIYLNRVTVIQSPFFLLNIFQDAYSLFGHEMLS